MLLAATPVFVIARETETQESEATCLGSVMGLVAELATESLSLSPSCICWIGLSVSAGVRVGDGGGVFLMMSGAGEGLQRARRLIPGGLFVLNCLLTHCPASEAWFFPPGAWLCFSSAGGLH